MSSEHQRGVFSYMAVQWRFWTRHNRSWKEPVPSCSPAGGGNQPEERQLRRMFQRHRIAAVPQGFRSSFRDRAAEETDHPREVIEAALAHVVQNRVEAAL